MLSSHNISSLLRNVFNVINTSMREASKKASSSTSYRGKRRPKRRGVKVSEGQSVPPGTILVLQNKLKYHPGKNVGIGRNFCLFAMEPGRVIVTCEKADLDWEHSFVQRMYNGRENQTIYKKYFHIIPVEQHKRFKLIDMV